MFLKKKEDFSVPNKPNTFLKISKERESMRGKEGRERKSFFYLFFMNDFFIYVTDAKSCSNLLFSYIQGGWK